MVQSRRSVLAAVAALFARKRDENAGTPAKIEIGCCVPVAQLQLAATIGYDFIEPAAADIASLSDEQFADVKQNVTQSPLRCECFNSLIRRPDLKVVGPEVELEPVLTYLRSTLARCRQLGASVVVWGSAGSRRVPDGFAREKAWTQIVDFLKRAAVIAAEQQIVLSIEPLNRKESNILNTASEALRMVNDVSAPSIGLMVDYYHLRMEHESVEIIRQAASKITHLHFANPAGRLWPARSSEDSEYNAFFEVLRETNWSGGLSVEGRGSLAEDGRSALEVLRRLIDRR